MGAGKTTVLAEASDVLAAADIAHAAIDLDALSIGYLPHAPEDLVIRNLVAVWSHFAAAGVDRLLIAEAIDSAAALERIRNAFPGAPIVVCRLEVGVETMQERVRQREPGMLQNQLVARVLELEASLDATRLEDFRIDNDGRSVTEVAREMLSRAAWL